jgi:hypothetical protein
VPDLHTLLVPIHYGLGAMKCGAIGLSIIRPALGHSVDEDLDRLGARVLRVGITPESELVHLDGRYHTWNHSFADE